MRFIVRSQDGGSRRGVCTRAITECALCSEDPRFCGNWD